MLTTQQIERQLRKFMDIPRHETQQQRIDRIKRELCEAVLHDYHGGVTILHLVEEFSLSESVVRKLINEMVRNGKLERELISRQMKGTTVTYATYKPKAA